jgi:hypothetical protein
MGPVTRLFSLILLCAGLAACAHKADLKTPSQIEAAAQKAEAKKAKEAEHNQ